MYIYFERFIKTLIDRQTWQKVTRSFIYVKVSDLAKFAKLE